MSVRVRFAPSPTGKLHVGNVRTALMNALFVGNAGGTFILRIDDTDVERSTQAFEEGIRSDLTWLGMSWQETFNQSTRFDLYEKAANKLRAEGLLYACYETGEELDRQRKLQRVQGKPPVYNRAGLALTDDEKSAFEAEGRSPHWRFKLSGGSVTWQDAIRGEQSIDTSSISDPVLIRGDGSFLYTLPSVVDDIDAGITHIIRGEDHVTNSGAQIEIFKALSAHMPTFAHSPLLVGKDGGKLSKRFASLSMEELRGEGIEPLAICSLLAKIGTSDPIEIAPDFKTLVEGFSFGKIARAPARFDEDELALLNARLLNHMPFGDVEARLLDMGVQGGAEFWELVRANISKLSDARQWNDIIYGEITRDESSDLDQDDLDFCKLAATSLPSDITEQTWSEWTTQLKAQTGRKGKTLFLPLRKALTGQGRGPEMNRLLVMMGYERAHMRLKGG